MAETTHMLLDAVINGNTSPTAGEKFHNPALNSKFGGKGFSAQIGRLDRDGIPKAEWISSQAHVERDLVTLLIQLPKFMNYMPDAEDRKRRFKAFIEIHPDTITGIDTEMTVETEDNQLGPSGSLFIEEPTGTRINRSTIVYEVTERLGRIFKRDLKEYIRYGIGDPHTQKVHIGSISEKVREIFRNGLYTADYYSFTTVMFEPDHTFSHVVEAYLHFGAFPKNSGADTAGFNPNSAKAISKLSITMAGSVITSPSINAYAQKLLEGLTVRNTNPMNILPFKDKDADASDTSNPYGYNSGNSQVVSVATTSH